MNLNANRQRGFTLLEIVIVVLIVGFLLAGVLKGQEMITSAKVKRVAGQLDEIRAAYLGFQDRFKALPGDYREANLTLDCGSPCLRGNGDSRIRANETPVNGSQVHEDLLVWTHLARSGFLKGDYRMIDGESLPTDTNSPKNPYQIYLQIVFDGRYGMNDGGSAAPQPEDGWSDPGRGAAGAGSQGRRRQTIQGRSAVLDLPGKQRSPVRPRAGRTAAPPRSIPKRTGICRAGTLTAGQRR